MATASSSLGHELSGVIEEVGSQVRDLVPADMATAEEIMW